MVCTAEQSRYIKRVQTPSGKGSPPARNRVLEARAVTGSFKRTQASKWGRRKLNLLSPEILNGKAEALNRDECSISITEMVRRLRFPRGHRDWSALAAG